MGVVAMEGGGGDVSMVGVGGEAGGYQSLWDGVGGSREGVRWVQVAP